MRLFKASERWKRLSKVPADAFINYLNSHISKKTMLSIIIPTLNEEKYLPKLLDSIKKQAYRDYELIVADHNSSDDTRKIAKKYGCKITEGGKHPGVARNNGARKAKGDMLFFIDADCILEKDFLERALGEMERRKLGAAGCYVWLLSRRLSDKLAFTVFNFWTFATQSFYPNASGAGIFCRRAIHRKIGGFDEKIIFSEDMDYVRRAGKHGKFGILKVSSYTAARRFDEEGRLNIWAKLFLSAVYRILFGEIKTDLFRYRLGHRK